MTSKYDPLDMALGLRAAAPGDARGATRAGRPSGPATRKGSRTTPPEPPVHAKAARRQLNVRVLEQTAHRLRTDTLVIAGTHSTGDVIDWLVEHHLADAVQALSSTSAERRQGVRPRR